MNILWTILVGFVIGLLAQAIMPGKDSGGFLLTTALGIVGAVIGSLLGQSLGFYNQGEPAGLLMSVLGAFLLLFVVECNPIFDLVFHVNNQI